MATCFQFAPFVAPPSYPNSIVWSEENLVAIASGNLITILNPSSLLGPRGVITLPPNKPFPIGVVREEEHAYTMRLTMSGNVYSFGVILLELLIGKPLVGDGIELAKWALSYSSKQDEREQILDSRISRTSLGVRNEMLSVLKIALGDGIRDRPDKLTVGAKIVYNIL